MFGNDRNEMRQMFYTAWKNFNNKTLLQPLEQIIVTIIQQHPEYHALLADESSIDKDFTPEMGQTNPFLHMSMHIAIHEQLSTQRPAIIQDVYQSLRQKHRDAHQAEHEIMECLGQMLWQAQRDQTSPNEQHYIECIQGLVP